MKQVPSRDKYLQIQAPAIIKRQLGIRAVETRGPFCVNVLRALQAYGVPLLPAAIRDRRKGRP